jgi:hypothetical protein
VPSLLGKTRIRDKKWNPQKQGKKNSLFLHGVHHCLLQALYHSSPGKACLSSTPLLKRRWSKNRWDSAWKRGKGEVKRWPMRCRLRWEFCY